ncbi:hypothetical protein [Nocardia arizonensis]|uniref:hypothetical protein n=1 Tax=Nocardia arizonensis TaxID=1141647 RepID=UPI0006D221BE|nr:hypothetical protein [Nocardia arizonensis]
MDDITWPGNREPDDYEDLFLALPARDATPRRESGEREDTRDTPEEQSAKARILANLGLRRDTSGNLRLSDTELAETLEQWALQPVRSLPEPDRGGSDAIEVAIELDDPVVTEILDGQASLHLVVSTEDIDGEETRIEARAALPHVPRIHDAVLLAVLTCGVAGHLVSFPLRPHNDGSDDFPLWSLIGGATVPPYGPVRGVRLRIERHGDTDDRL